MERILKYFLGFGINLVWEAFLCLGHRFIGAALSPCRCLACEKPKWLQELACLVFGADRPTVLSIPCVGVSDPAQACRCYDFPCQGSEIADLEQDLRPALLLGTSQGPVKTYTCIPFHYNCLAFALHVYWKSVVI